MRTADEVETDYHATVNLIVLLSYWLREHPFSEVRGLVFDLREQLGQQLAHNIYELTEISDTELCEEEAEEAWRDFQRALKEQREAREGDAEDEPESEAETARGTLGADASREEVIKASQGKSEPEADEEARNPFRMPTAAELTRATNASLRAALGMDPSESQPTKEDRSERDELKAREEAVRERLEETAEEIQANPPRWSERIAALEEWREVTDERVTMLEKDEEMRSDAVNFLETEVEDLKDRAKGCETRIATLEMSRDDYVDDVNRRLITMEKAMARAETRRDATLAAIGETLAMKCRESLDDEDENAASGLRDVLERNDEIRCDTCGETILRRDDDAWSEAAAEAAIGEHMDRCKPTDPPAGLQPGPPTEPGLYLVACDPPAFSSMGWDQVWAVCTAAAQTNLLVCHHRGGSLQIPSEHVIGCLKLPEDPAEGLPLLMGWKAGAPPTQEKPGKVYVVRRSEGGIGVTDGIRMRPTEHSPPSMLVYWMTGRREWALPDAMEFYAEVPDKCPA